MSFLNDTIMQLRSQNTSDALISLVQQVLHPIIIGSLQLPQVKREDIPGLDLVKDQKQTDDVPQIVMKWEQEGITLLLAITFDDYSIICIDTQRKKILYGRQENLDTIVNDISLKLGHCDIPVIMTE